MQAVKVVILMALLAKVAVVAHNSVAPKVTTGARHGTCPSQIDRDAAQQNLQSAVSSIILQRFGNGGVGARCGSGLWYRVAYLNMTDPTQQCPAALREYSANGVRACGRPSSLGLFSCSSLNFTSGGRQYSKVCGQVIGYQIGSTDIFANQQNSIDTGYVDGVSVTHGSSSRTHIWTYAAGLSETFVPNNDQFTCACVVAGRPTNSQIPPPPFVGDNYYCESGTSSSTFEHTDVLRYTSDPLWDGQQCEGQCCSNGRTPPWFSVTLTTPTSDDIEVRICGTESTINEDTPIEIMELYVQ